jgi:hypothetical protein
LKTEEYVWFTLPEYLCSLSPLELGFGAKRECNKLVPTEFNAFESGILSRCLSRGELPILSKRQKMANHQIWMVSLVNFIKFIWIQLERICLEWLKKYLDRRSSLNFSSLSKLIPN